MRRQKDFFKLQHQLSEAKAAKQTKQTRQATTTTTTAAAAKPLPPLAVHYSISIQLLLLLLLSHSRGLNLSSNKSLHCLCVYIIFIHCLSVPVLASPCLPPPFPCPASRRVDTLRAMFINKAQRQESPKSMLRLFFVSPHTAKSNNERKRKGDKTLRESAKRTSDSASPDAAKLAKPSDR